jgi:predicted small metal-binding protein
MAKIFECGSVVPGCRFVAHGPSKEELVMKAADHLRSTHNVDHLSDRLRAKIRAVIRDDWQKENNRSI